MEVFTLAVVSLAIAVFLIFTKGQNRIHLSLAYLCLALFFYKGGGFFAEHFHSGFWSVMEMFGLLAISPLIISFGRLLLSDQSLLSLRQTIAAAFISLILLVSLFTPLADWVMLIYIYPASVLAFCYGALILFIRSKPAGMERTRILYLSIAFGMAALISALDVIKLFGYDFSPLYNIFIAVLMYMIFLIVNHPRLMELHEVMARALITGVLTLCATFVIYVFIRLFGRASPSSLTYILLASFLIVISIEPLKEVLKNIFSWIYPESKEAFNFLYAFDQKLEREKSMLLEEMAPVLAHEIRNPLGSIKGAAQYLRSEVMTDEDKRLIDVIIEEVNRLNSVVNQFLSYAKPYSPKLKLQDVNAVIAKAISIVKANDLMEKIVIEEELRPELPLVNVDAEQLIQVILNIAVNALEAMPAGGKLIFRTRRIDSDQGEAVTISIRDTGKGIKKDELRNVFKPFFTTRERGVGLGLSICQRIIKSHGGHIRVKSIPGQGSIFYIRLRRTVLS
jgi:two-component system, NtrC family, sensor histidine kinase HydH